MLPWGSVVWRYRFRINGKREKFTLGTYPGLFLKDARAKHADLRAKVTRGENPAREKRQAKLILMTLVRKGGRR